MAEEQLRYQVDGMALCGGGQPPSLPLSLAGGFTSEGTVHGRCDRGYARGLLLCRGSTMRGAHCFPAWPPSGHGHDSGLPRIDPDSEHASTLPSHDAPAQSAPTG